MPAITRRTDLPVLLLHNVDPTWGREDIDLALHEADDLQQALCSEGHPVTTVGVWDANLASHLQHRDPNQWIVFNWCEDLPGIPHSDILVAETLSAMGFVYTGSTAETLALSWNKRKVKRLLDHLGLPTPRWRVYDAPWADDWDCFPAIVKPSFEHSSLGVSTDAVVLTSAELNDRIDYVMREFPGPALVEDFIDGREFHVGLWGDGLVEMLPPAEMDFSAFDDVHDRLCTFDSKFVPQSVAYNQIQVRVPAPLTPEEYQRLERTAVAAYHAFGCRDYARLDIRLRDGVFYVLDVNPNPDISSDTSMSCAAEAAGYSRGEMASYLVNLAAQRHPRIGRAHA